jgi:pimeloyl-ACP methyl ester carboxylesterase
MFNVLDCLDSVIREQHPFVRSVWFRGIHILQTTDPLYIFFHGTGGSSITFIDIIVDLSKRGIAAIAPDLPGWGITHKTDENDTAFYDNLAEYVGKDRSVIIVGHSLGCIASTMLPVDNVKKIVWASPPGIFQFRHWIWLRMISWGFPEKLITYPVFKLLFLPLMLLGNKRLRFWCAYWTNPLRRNSYRIIASYVKNDAWTVNPMLNRRSVPIQLVGGGWDPILRPTTGPMTIIEPYAGHNPLTVAHLT